MTISCLWATGSEIGAMVVLITPERIELESCACAQIKTLEDGSGRFHPDEAGDPSEKERNAANLFSDGGCLFFQTGAMVLLIFPERIKLQSCACTQMEAVE